MHQAISAPAPLQPSPATHDAQRSAAGEVRTVYIMDMMDEAEAAAWDAEMERRGF